MTSGFGMPVSLFALFDSVCDLFFCVPLFFLYFIDTLLLFVFLHYSSLVNSSFLSCAGGKSMMLSVEMLSLLGISSLFSFPSTVVKYRLSSNAFAMTSSLSERLYVNYDHMINTVNMLLSTFTISHS